MRSSLFASWCCIAFLLAVSTSGQEDPATRIPAARAALARGDLESAQKELEPLLAATPDGEALELAIAALEAKGDLAAALPLADRALGSASDGVTRTRAAFVRSRLLLSLGRREESLAAARLAIDALRDPARRLELAQVWLDLAKYRLEPPSTATASERAAFVPNWAEALVDLDAALATDALSTKTAEAELDRLHCLSELKAPVADRIASARRVLSSEGLAVERRAACLERLVEAHLDELDVPRALAVARDLEALGVARERAVRAWSRVAHATANDLARLTARREAVARVIALEPASEIAETVRLRLAETYAQFPAWRDLAIELLEGARAARPTSAKAAETELRIADLRALTEGPIAALPRLEKFLEGRAFDDASRLVLTRIESLMQHEVDRLDEAIGSANPDEKKELRAATLAARRRFVERYPAHDSIPAQLLAMSRLEHALSEFDAADSTRDALRTRFPTRDETLWAIVEQARDLRERKFDFDGALALLDTVPAGSPASSAAAGERSTIVDPALEFEVTPVVRGGESPKPKLRSRNVKTVEISLYRIDLRDFFLATGHFDVLGALDVSLIAADRKFTLEGAPDDAALRRELVREVALDPMTPGEALVVAARAGSLETHSLVVCSDLDVAIVRTAGEVLAFGVDRKTGAKQEVAVRIAASGKLLPKDEPVTREAANCSLEILAIAQNGLAAIETSHTVPEPVVRARSGTIVIDRPSARPNESVRFVGVAQDAQGLALTSGLTIRIETIDHPRTVYDEFPISPLGNGQYSTAWTVAAGLVSGRSTREIDVSLVYETGNAGSEILATTRFRIGAFTNAGRIIHFEPVGDAPRAGAEATLLVRITDSDGFVRPDTNVAWRVNGGEERKTRTDVAGRFVVDLATADTIDRDRVEVSVELGDERDTFSAPLRTGRTELSIESGSPPYQLVAGDSIDLGLRLLADGVDPVAGNVSWVLVKKKASGDAAIGSGALETGADGRAKLSVQVATPGRFELLLSSTGVYGLPEQKVLGFTSLPSDGAGLEAPELIASESARPGGKVELRAIWPFEASRALFVVFGDRLDRTEIVALERGVNRFTIDAPVRPLPWIEVRLIALERSAEAFELISIERPIALEIAAPERITSNRDGIEAKLTLVDATYGPGLRAFAFVADERIAGRIAAHLSFARSRRIPKLPNRVVTTDSSGDFVPGVATSTIDPTIDQAIEDIAFMAGLDEPAVMVDSLELDEMVRRRNLSEDDAQTDTGGATYPGPTTGGAGTAHGGGGGTGQGRAPGGGGVSRDILDEPPFLFTHDLTFEAGTPTTLRFAPPARPGRYTIVACVVDPQGEIAVASHSFLHDPALVGTLALVDDETKPRTALLSLSRRDRRNGSIEVDLLSADASAPPISRRSIELGPNGAAEARIDVPAALVHGVVKLGDELELTFRKDAPAPSRSEFATSWRNPLVIADARRAAIGAESVTIYATPLAALAGYDAGDDRDAEATEWNVFARAEALRQTRKLPPDPAHPDSVARLELELKDALARMRAGLVDDGARPVGDTERASIVLLALDAAADAGGVAEEPWFNGLFEATIARVDAELLRARTADLRALPLYALACADRAPYEKLNRLARELDSLRPRELALLVLAFKEADRTDDAARVAARLETSLVDVDRVFATDAPSTGALYSRAEVAALIALALPGNAAALALATTELASIPQDAPSGAVPLSMIAWIRDFPAPTSVTLRGAGGDRPLEFVGRAELGVAQFTPARLEPATGEIVIDPGSAVLFATVPGAPTPVLSESAMRATRSIRRTMAHRNGEEIAVGSGLLGGRIVDPPSNVDRLGVGRTYDVEVRITLDPALRSFWWFEPTLPGTTLIESSLSFGPKIVRTPTGHWFAFDALSENARVTYLRYSIRAEAPGSFVAPQNQVRSHRAAGSKSVETESPSYTIEAGDIDTTYPLSPNEAVATGLAAKRSKRDADAMTVLSPHLDRLLDPDANATLRSEVLRALLDAALVVAPDAEIVRLFEIAKERDPDHVLGFDAMDRVARAYAAIGEWERGRHVLSAIGDALFLQEARAIGRLEASGRDEIAVRVVERLLREQDVTATTLETAFALGQHAAERARTAKKSLPANDPGLTRAEWLLTSRRALERHLTFAPTDAASEEVTLTLANLLLDAADELEASRLASSAAKRFATGRFTATWPYIEAFAALRLRDLDGAIRHAEELVRAAERSKDPVQRDLAAIGRHMLAQAWHGKGDLKKAREYYQAIRETIVDARLVLEQLDRSALVAPPIVMCASGADLVIPLDRKGLTGEVELSLYPMDLRLLYLKNRGFDELSELELAGVMPAKRQSLAPTRDSVTLGERVTLPSPGKGAYLVLLRCGDLHARLLALVSDLAIEATPLAGGARVSAFDRASGAPRSDVVVTFVGSSSSDFVTRKTDLRGIAAAENLRGTLAVIAEIDGHYAFFQDDEELESRAEGKDRNGMLEDADEPASNEAYRQLESERAKNDAVWKQNTNRAQQGVEIRRTKK